MRNGEIAWLAFTEKGRALALRLSAALGGEVSCTGDGVSLRDWTAKHFKDSRALVFVGAAGIAVRAVAPYLEGKAGDPAVVAVDECARFAVPLLSGHLGGANALAREIARCCDAEAVITTATDRNGVFAFDEWARLQGLAVADPKKIKAVSARLLAGEPVTVRSAFPIGGEPPAGVCLTESGDADVWVDVRAHDDALTLGRISGRDGNKIAHTRLTPVALSHGVGYKEAELTFVCRKICAQQFDFDATPPHMQQGMYSKLAPHYFYIGAVEDAFGEMKEWNA